MPMSEKSAYQTSVDAFKRDLLMKVLRRVGNKRRAAQELKVAPSTITRECRRLGIRFKAVVEVA